MPMYSRAINILKSSSFFLFGARATGKSTLLRKEIETKNSIFINLLKFKEFSSFDENPDQLRNRIMEDTDWVIIDEVQKVPKLLDVVHDLIEDENINVKFALSGSSARKLRAGGANLLAGRAFVYDLFPLSAFELKEDFDLFDSLAWGLFPAVANFKSFEEKKLYLEAYTNTYLKEEIWDEHLVKDLKPFRRFLNVAAQSNNTIINYSKIANDVRVDTKTVQRYFQILEDTLIGFMLERYSPSVRKKQKANPKFYLIDIGLYRGITGSFSLQLTSLTLGFGLMFEHFLILEFFKRNSYFRTNFQFSFIRDNKDREVDLVVEKPDGNLFLIEIKSTDSINEEHVESLKFFSLKYPKAKCYCFSRDTIKKNFDGIKAIHWKEGLVEIGLGE